MTIAESWASFKKNKGLWQFTARSALFLAILFAVYLAIFMWFRHTQFFLANLQLGEDYYIPFLTGLRKTDFLNAALFAAIAFSIWNREKLAKLKPTERNAKETATFAVLAAAVLIGHYAFKYLLVQTAPSASGLVVLAKYLFNIGFVALLAYACYTQRTLHALTRKHWRSMLAFAGIAVAYFFLIQLFQKIWYPLSHFVSLAVKTLLSLNFATVSYSAGNLTTGPRIGVQGFRVGISDACSGIDSLLLFISLYSLIFILDYKRMHVKRMWALLLPGLAMTIAYNILRIYALILVGVYIDPEFAVDTFHTNAGWILFLLFFIIFWHFGSKWVYKKKSARR